MIDPTYQREQIAANPEWDLAFVLSEIQNDEAPIGWSRYISTAKCLLAAFDIGRKGEPRESWNADDFPLPHWAVCRSHGKYMEEGAQLATRDGRRFGNAYVDRIEPHDKLGQVAVVITDMGSVMRMTVSELEEGFYPPVYIMRIEEARSARLRPERTVNS